MQTTAQIEAIGKARFGNDFDVAFSEINKIAVKYKIDTVNNKAFLLEAVFVILSFIDKRFNRELKWRRMI